MSDDLNKKIKQITDILGQESMPDNIKGLLSLFASSAGKEEPEPKTEVPAVKEDRTNRSEMEDSMDMVRKIKGIMDRVNFQNDPSINLLNSVKPFLNNKRQRKLDNCIKLLQMSRLTKIIDE